MTQEFDNREDGRNPSPLSSYSLSEYLDALTTGVMEEDFGIADPQVAGHLVDLQSRGMLAGALLPRSPLTSALVQDLPAALHFSLNSQYFSGREQALIDFRRELGDALLYVQGFYPEHPERLFSRLREDVVPLYQGRLDELGSASYAAAAELADQLDDPLTSLWQRMSDDFPVWRSVLRRVREAFA